MRCHPASDIEYWIFSLIQMAKTSVGHVFSDQKTRSQQKIHIYWEMDKKWQFYKDCLLWTENHIHTFYIWDLWLCSEKHLIEK